MLQALRLSQIAQVGLAVLGYGLCVLGGHTLVTTLALMRHQRANVALRIRRCDSVAPEDVEALHAVLGWAPLCVPTAGGKATECIGLWLLRTARRLRQELVVPLA